MNRIYFGRMRTTENLLVTKLDKKNKKNVKLDKKIKKCKNINKNP